MSNPKNTRRCIVCHEHAQKTEMIRFVKDKDCNIFVDRTQKADGRGVWVHDSAECKAKLVKKKMLNSAFKCNCGEGIYGEIDV